MGKGSVSVETREPSSLLVQNWVQAAILRLARTREGPVSRSKLPSLIGVSRSKVSMEVQRLSEGGLLAEYGLAESEGGRRSSLLGIPPSAGLIAAVDLGATSIDVALMTLGGEILAHRGEPADIKDGPRIILGRVKVLLEELLGEQSAESREVLSVGIGISGPVEHAAGVLRSPPIMPGWDRFLIQDEFAAEYAAPVF